MSACVRSCARVCVSVCVRARVYLLYTISRLSCVGIIYYLLSCYQVGLYNIHVGSSYVSMGPIDIGRMHGSNLAVKWLFTLQL